YLGQILLLELLAYQEVLVMMLGARFTRREDCSQPLGIHEGQFAQVQLDLKRAGGAQSRDRRFQLFGARQAQLALQDQAVPTLSVLLSDVEHRASACSALPPGTLLLHWKRAPQTQVDATP